MAVLSVNDFKQQLAGGGARPNLFKVTFRAPPGIAGVEAIRDEKTSFMCRAAQLPSSIMGNIIVPFRGRQVQIAGDRVFEPWVATVFNDTDFAIRTAMETWMNGINNHEDNSGVTTPDQYQVDLDVEQLDKNGDTLYTYKFVGAFPTNISPIDLSYDNNDIIEEFSIEFQIQYWHSFNQAKAQVTS
jgi:hypothetical protein